MTDGPLAEIAREHGIVHGPDHVPAPQPHTPTVETLQQSDDDLTLFNPDRCENGAWIIADIDATERIEQ